MFNRTLLMVLGCLSSSLLWSFPCYITVAKDSCWTNYNVKVDVIDDINNKVLTTVNIPAGKSWTREQFNCQPALKLMYHAQFTPSFWEGDAGKVYVATRFWFMPGEIKEGEVAWTIPVCFPQAFAEVPFPPDAKTGNCACDFSTVPPIESK